MITNNAYLIFNSDGELENTMYFDTPQELEAFKLKNPEFIVSLSGEDDVHLFGEFEDDLLFEDDFNEDMIY